MSKLGGVIIAVFFSSAAAQAQNPAATVAVDANANRRAITPNVYGLAYASTAQLTDLNVPLNRYGGNNSSRYNWQVNGDNRDADWYFESIGDASSVAGGRGETLLLKNRAGGGQAMNTVPPIWWGAKPGARPA